MTTDIRVRVQLASGVDGHEDRFTEQVDQSHALRLESVVRRRQPEVVEPTDARPLAEQHTRPLEGVCRLVDVVLPGQGSLKSAGHGDHPRSM